MTKDLSVGVLMDFYSELLTDKQRDALNLYYDQDLSLAEIAQHMGISRQGVRDFIKRGEAQLFEFEEKLHLLERFSKISYEISKSRSIVKEIKSSVDDDKLKTKLDKISISLGTVRDYL